MRHGVLPLCTLCAMTIQFVRSEGTQAQTTHLFGSLTPSAAADVTIIGIDQGATQNPIRHGMTIGDLDGNGSEELAFVAASPASVYVLYTTESHFQSGTVHLQNINGFGGNNSLNGFEFQGNLDPFVPISVVAGTGDVNNDGFDDFAIGQLGVRCGVYDPMDPRFFCGADQVSAGHTYLLYGGNGTNSPPPLSGSFTATAEPPGARYYGPGTDWLSGNAAIKLGDLNDDGVGDFAFASHAADVVNFGPFPPGFTEDTGAIHLVFGQSSSSFLGTRNAYDVGNVDLATSVNSPGFTILGAGLDDAFGDSLAYGDVSGDNVPELIVGASDQWGNGTQSTGGKVYVFDGQALLNRFQNQQQLAGRVKLGSTEDDLVYATFDANAGSGVKGLIGRHVSTVGDVNGDGIGDFVMSGSPHTSSSKSYLILGRQDGFTGTIDDDAIGDSIDGRSFNSPPSMTTPTLSAAGDVNGDGLADLLISQKSTSSSGNGIFYVVYGRPDVDTMVFDPLNPSGSTGGFVLNDGNSTAAAQNFSAVGDVDGDGESDLMFTDGSAGAGTSYLILGVQNHAGDLNTDGNVDLADKAIVQNAFGSSVIPGVWALGDPSGDGVVGLDDLNIVNNNLGFSYNPAPEPGTAPLLGLAVLAQFCCLRARRKNSRVPRANRRRLVWCAWS